MRSLQALKRLVSSLKVHLCKCDPRGVAVRSAPSGLHHGRSVLAKFCHLYPTRAGIDFVDQVAQPIISGSNPRLGVRDLVLTAISETLCEDKIISPDQLSDEKYILQEQVP